MLTSGLLNRELAPPASACLPNGRDTSLRCATLCQPRGDNAKSDRLTTTLPSHMIQFERLTPPNF
ncbi:unnamed protein product, partial [marine sediment metagenome]